MGVPHHPLFIAGRWVDTADRYDLRSPATGELVATAARGGITHVDQAVDAAAAAHAAGDWRRTPPAERAALLHRVADRLQARLPELAALQSRENGATIRVSTALHLGLSIAHLRYLADLAGSYAFERPGPAMDPLPTAGLLRREPLGVVAAIVPWNIPLLVTIWKVAPALAAGNTVVLKPDEHAPLLPLELAAEFAAAGLPAGVLNVVTGDGDPVGAHLAAHPTVRKVAFTGSTEVGRAILRAAAGTVKRVTLELGGKGPNIILADADLPLVVDGALYAALANNGQACEAGTRLLVPAARQAEIVEALVDRAKGLRLGDPLDPATDVGPVISAGQRDRILGRLAAARAEGATIALGGATPTGPGFDVGYWVEPTVVTGAAATARIAREEVFGPVLTVLSYDSVDEAVALANDSDYGLSAGVWSADEARALDVARRLDAGMVYVNDWHVIHPAYPFGGTKQSGLGREGGPDALDAYTEQKIITLDRAGGLANRPAFGLVLGAPPEGLGAPPAGLDASPAGLGASPEGNHGGLR
ncbi:MULTISPECIES: aldehyde dehydrogenase family protein [Frankia]|uniref:Acetaldehyde dehydrogenase n=1 Tax=Frankia alni (strain DSM 45986 / CECT 9034 / ACN14a) TaxID=326424 RepID=Q0RQ57_FRAAA|nr:MULTISPECIES: aldehyde dehydrogenase family protein [Frankia]CAJ60320.1 acetaldehyde dehydrogenase [Frankia alni ACN14a]